MERIIKKPLLSFEQWVRSKGIELPPDHVIAEVIGGALEPHKTRASRGKWRSKVKVLGQYQRARDAYAAAIRSGEIPTIEERVPLDMTKAADAAYARAMEKRAQRRALFKD